MVEAKHNSDCNELLGLLTRLVDEIQSNPGEDLLRENLRDLIDRTRAGLSDSHSRTADELHKLAEAFVAHGKLEVGKRLYQHGIALLEEEFAADHPDLLPLLNGLSKVYLQLGRCREARKCAERTLAVAEESFAGGSREGRLVPALQVIAIACLAEGRFRAAHEAARRALDIQCRTCGDDSLEAAMARGQLGVVYARIGETMEALSHFQRELEILKRLTGTDSEDKISVERATTLMNLAGTYLDLDEAQKARSLYEEALELRRSVSGAKHPETARILSNLALLLCRIGEDGQALNLWRESLDIRREALGKLHPDVARSMIDVAYGLRKVSKGASATTALLEAIAILACFGMPFVAARAYFLLATIVESRSLDAAIFLAKLAVNRMQDLRSDIAGLGAAYDKAFVDTREQAYRVLGDALIVAGRLPEAQQVLDMLKRVELSESTEGDIALKVTQSSLTPLEASQSERAEQILTQLKCRFDALTGRSGGACNDSGTDLGLEQALKIAVMELQEWLDTLLSELGRIESRTRHEGGRALSPVEPAGADLRKNVPSGTALLQYLLTGDHLRIVLTAAGLVRSYDVRIAEREVNRLTYRLRITLQDRADGFKDSARRLHELLIAPVIADLHATGARTLGLSLDGVLRYLPFAVLHDGNRYMLDDFALAFAAGPRTEAAPPKPPSDLYAVGFGVTEAVRPRIGTSGAMRPDDAHGCASATKSLPGVREELKAVIRTGDDDCGILPGVIRLNGAFTADAVREALSAGCPVIHIASHFTFHAGREASSCLLLGDGETLTLGDLARLRMGGVEMIVLSACDTALGGGHRHSGREIEGLGAVVLHQGARNAIATLWRAGDFTAAAVLRGFYHHWYRDGLEPPQALRRAQLALRNRELRGGDPGASRALIDPEDRPGAGWDHPWFWAPYLLMGEVCRVGPP
jgi:CHAT domain-containing protein/tetratricopeptide (TPR) repeat protein